MNAKNKAKQKRELPFHNCLVMVTLVLLAIFYFQKYSGEFSSYFNVMWTEPRLHIPKRFLTDLNATSSSTQAMIPVNLELVNELWLPIIFIYNLKTFKVCRILNTKPM